MYKIEITTNDDMEKLIACYEVDTWADAYNKIEEIKKLDLDAFIKLYEDKREGEHEENNIEYLGEFSHIKKRYTPRRGTEKKKIKFDNIIILLLGFMLFPVMILFKMMKEE